jgi:F0F1-type ATP synthase alpha subunit
VESVQRFRDEALDFIASAHPEIGESIVTEKKLTDETEASLRKALDEFAASFTE